MKQALKYTQNKDKLSNCVVYSIPLHICIYLLYLVLISLMLMSIEESESAWEEGFQKERDRGGKRDAERKNKSREIKKEKGTKIQSKD